ncbi:MAG: HAD family hydrolase [Spirochaetales bacterium]
MSEDVLLSDPEAGDLVDTAAVVFDFDGVLVDSIAVHRQSWMLAFREVLGRELPQVPKHEVAGKSTYEIGAVFARYAGASEHSASVAEAKIRILESNGLLPEALPGAREVTRALRARGIPYGIASNAPGSYVRRVAETLGFHPQAALGFEDVERPKPDPGAYIACAHQLGIQPRERRRVLVCEDSVPGLTAALNAGMRTLAVTTTADEHTLRACGAEIIADDLLDAAERVSIFTMP